MKRSGWIARFVAQYRRALLIALGLGIAAAVFSVALMFTSGYLISAAAEEPPSIFELMIPLAFVQIFGIGRPFLSYLERLRAHDWVLAATSGLRRRLFTSLAIAGRRGIPQFSAGKALGLLAQDVEHMQDLFIRCALPACVAWVTCLIAVIAFGVFSWRFALVMLLVVVVTAVLMPLVSALLDAARRARVAALASQMYEDVTDDLLGLGDWIRSGRREDFVARVQDAAAAADVPHSASLNFSRKRDLVLQAVFLVAIILIVCWAASRFGGTRGGAADLIAAFVVAFFPLAELIAPLADAGSAARVHLDAATRLDALPNPDTNTTPAQSSPVPSAHPNLSLNNVHFSYPHDAHEIVCGISLDIPFAQKLAILGPSGSGKSTLIGLMRGDLLPTHGSVELDGVPVSSLESQVSQWISVLDQDPHVFDDTLLGNVRIGNPAATEDDVRRALERVGLKELVAASSQGLNMSVGENGAHLSGGQRHRLALARVLLRDTPVVLLDEPFCALDPVSESHILDTLFDVCAEKTVVLVTHHLMGVERMDRVVFVEGGDVVLDGSPQALTHTSERYRRLLEFDRGESV